MKRLISSLLVLCVVAPAFAVFPPPPGPGPISGTAYRSEYTWAGPAGASGDFTAGANWTRGTSNLPATLGVAPAAPVEDHWVWNPATVIAGFEPGAWHRNRFRATIGNGGTVLINTDLSPTNHGTEQLQVNAGTVRIGAGGRLLIYQYFYSTAATGTQHGLFVENGGQYINVRTGVHNQDGHFLTYQTTNSTGFTTISGQGTLFHTEILRPARFSTTQTGRVGIMNIIGSGSTINIGEVSSGPMGVTISARNTVLHWNFFADENNAISPVNILNWARFSDVHIGWGNTSILNFVLGAAPEIGDVFTLFAFAPGAVRAPDGRLTAPWGTVLEEGSILNLWHGGEVYGLRMSYVGGTGQDVTLTVIPEPATLGLLSLGGLLLARRRRA